MKTAMTLGELASELHRQNEAKVDYLADTRDMRFSVSGDDLSLEIKGADELAMRESAHGQFANRLGVPKKYYDRMRSEAPDLLVRNLNHWLEAEPAKRFVRTLDRGVRAFLSDRYRPLDNWDFANAVLPAITECGGEIASCAITETQLYLKVTRPDMVAEILPVGVESIEWGKGNDTVDIVEAGLILGNSEVGGRALYLEPGIHTRKCTNMAVFRDDLLRRNHSGSQLKIGGDGASETGRYLTTETRAAADKALWLEVRDTTKAAMDGRIFDDYVERLRVARGVSLQASPTEVVKVVSSRLDLSEGEGESVLEHLIAGGDLTQYGLHSAVTRASQDVADYGRATELEYLGGDVISLSPDDWTPSDK